MADMENQRKLRIAVDTGTNQKAVRGRCSGFMRHVMERSLPWDIRFFASWEVQARQAWNRLILKWKPDGIVLKNDARMRPEAQHNGLLAPLLRDGHEGFENEAVAYVHPVEETGSYYSHLVRGKSCLWGRSWFLG